uniref:Non-specific serine/threonine protein kinase n=1 Tax=Fagus sylvatica TaxID=28930 RepID=A0A2N9I388_FAGSY
MTNIFFLSFLLSSIFTAKAQQGQSIVKPGSLLTPTTNSSWLSPSDLYAFGFYKQGNGYAVGVFLIGIPQKTVVWTANRDNPPLPDDVKLNFTSDGRLVLQSTQAFRVMYSSVSESNQSTRIFRILMQGDGNLVQYPVGTQVVPGYDYWSTSTNGKGNNVSLCLDDDAHRYLLNSSGTYLMNLTQGGYPRNGVVYLMRIDADGILRLYSHNLAQNGNRSVLWASTDDKCDPKGICGLNGFCVTSNQDFDCICLPGFAFVNQSKKTSGCERNFTAESCEVGSLRYTMEAVPNTTWENANFSILLLPTKEDCIAACLGDFNCEAVLFKNGECNKQRLPLRFGRRSQSESNVALIKVELEKVTDGFKEELGRGAFGTVYKGVIGNDKKNLVRLLGYCHDGPNRLLVYEYMSNGSLADVLFTPEKQPCWNERMEIACNVARGILYLHEECMPHIIHCDIKPQNILMDEYRCAKISDFGLAKLLNPDQTKTFTDIRGTRGYVAPEWHRKSPVTVKVDVYSFGVVLLEIICCRKNVDYNLSEEEAILEEWACHCFETGESDKLVNDEDVDKGQLERMIKVAIWCIQDEPSIRPSMKKVLLMLEGTVEILIPPSLTIVTTM